jgi:hypothetical protein
VDSNSRIRFGGYDTGQSGLTSTEEYDGTSWTVGGSIKYR